jgi:hypothetical protein
MAATALPSPHDPPHDVRWKWLLLAACALAFAVLCSALIDNFGLGGKPWAGWWNSLTAMTDQPFVVQIVGTTNDGATARAGIRDGDRIDLRDLNRYARGALLVRSRTTKTTNLVIRRDGRIFTTQLHASTIYQGNEAVNLPEVVLLFLACYLAFGCACVIAARRSQMREGRYLCLTLLAIAGTCIGPGWLSVPNGTLGALNYLTSGVLQTAQPLLLVALAAKFGIRSAWRVAVEVAAIAACTLTLAGYLAATIGLLNLSIKPIPFVLGTFWQVLGVCIFAIAVIAAVLATASTARAERARAVWLLLPLPIALFASALVAGLPWLGTSWMARQGLDITSNAMLLTGALAVTFALLKRRVLDFNFIVSRTLTVATVSLIVVAAFVLLEWLLGSVVAGISHTTGLIANGALALVLGLSLNYIHKGVDDFIDALFFRKRREDERALRDFSSEAAYVTDSDALFNEAIEKIEDHTDARSAALLLDGDGAYTATRSFGTSVALKVSENDGAILALKTWRAPLDPHRYSTALQGALALPMVSRWRLLGVLLLGERVGGEAYAPDEVEALSQFAHGVGSAIDALSAGNTDSIAALRESMASMAESIGNAMRALPGSIAAELRDRR